jgi:hypothetical protein
LGGAGIAVANAVARDDAGFFSASLDSLRSPTPAITVEDVVVRSEPDVPQWVLDRLDIEIRLTATPVDPGQAIFLGFGPADAVDAYLAGTAHDQIVDISDRRVPTYRTTPGDMQIAPPTEQTFWTSKVSGTGQQVLTWRPSSGRWDAVLMNADGSAGVDVAATIGVRAGFLLPMALIMMVVGLVLTGAAVALIVFGASAAQAQPGPPGSYPAYGAPGVSGIADTAGPPVGGAVVMAGQEAPPVGGPTIPAAHPWAASPVALNAWLDDGLSRWMWLVKWLLAIPHFIVLAFLWCAFFVVAVIAFFAILFTARYPRGLFGFNLGVLRWSWRVEYYCAHGGLGTDRYPPFSLGAERDYPATLDIAYPDHLSRGLVLVKWWLLAIPQYLIVALFVGGGWGWTTARDGDLYRFDPIGGGVLGLLVIVAGALLLFSGRYPPSLYALIIGLNRWVYRVIAYAALMTDAYPPFQLDEGGSERPPMAPVPAPVSSEAVAPEAEPSPPGDAGPVTRS